MPRAGLAPLPLEPVAAATAIDVYKRQGLYNRAAFNRAMDALGMTFTFTPRMGAFRWDVVADSRSQEAAMELLVDAVVRPAFDGPLVLSLIHI